MHVVFDPDYLFCMKNLSYYAKAVLIRYGKILIFCFSLIKVSRLTNEAKSFSSRKLVILNGALTLINFAL